MNAIFQSNIFLIVFIMSSLNWFMTFLGSSLVYLVKKESKHLVSIALGLSAGIMIAASFFSLILPAYQQLSNQKTALLLLPLSFIIGASFLRISDFLIPHEHLLSHEIEGINVAISKNKKLLLAMVLHNIPEGLAVGIAFACHQQHLLPAMILSIGIGIQNLPEGTAISLPMHQAGMTKYQAMMQGQRSALVEIPSALIGCLFTSFFHELLPIALCFASGAMFFVCIEELIPEANATKDIDVGTMSFMIGFVLMMTLDIMFS